MARGTRRKPKKAGKLGKKPRKQQVAGFQKIDRWVWEGEDRELRRWMGRHGTVPENRPLVFDGGGNNVPIGNIRCGRTYFVMCRKKVRNPGCRNALRRRIAMARANVCAMRQARRVRRKCWLKPSCQVRVRLHFRGILCLGFEWDAGYIYKVECFRI